MSGIYIHIPFCSKKCNYCDFYSIVPQHGKQDFLETLLREIRDRREYLHNSQIETVYFGGGTPSLLTIKDLDSILKQINECFSLSPNLELTLEANPEDLSDFYIKDLKKLGVNRLSIGVQSFKDDDLVFLKRTHDATTAVSAVERAYSLGFDNISIDLIYGLPNLSLEDWKRNLQMALDLPINHLSSYHLTYEKDTLLYKRLKQGKVKPLKEEESVRQFEYLLDSTKEQGIPYYEISNFAKADYYSKHNRSYWQQKKYLGLGPSAHSYDGLSREWNVKNLNKYIDSISKGTRDFQKEILTAKDVENEFLITNIRTKWGIDLEIFEEKFGKKSLEYLTSKASSFIKSKSISIEDNTIKLTEKGILVSDYILESLYRI